MGVLSWGALCRAPMCALYRTLLLLVLVIVISSAQPHIERPSGANRLGDLFQYRWPSARGAAEPEELPPSLAVEVPSVGDVDPPSKQDQASQRARELREVAGRFEHEPTMLCVWWRAAHCVVECSDISACLVLVRLCLGSWVPATSTPTTTNTGGT